jgi:hypothetical protein
MNDFIYWIGAIHLAAYAVAGFSIAGMIFAEWLIERYKLKAALLQAYVRILKERKEPKP